MGIISKSFTFVPDTDIVSGQVNANFDTLFNVLSGAITSTRIRVVSTNSDSPLTVSQSSASASAFESQQGTSVKFKIKGSGALESLVPTGTAPISVQSVTQCPNLNASLLGGFAADDFAVIDNGVFEIEHDTPVVRLKDTSVGATDFELGIGLTGGVYALRVTELDTNNIVSSVDKLGKATFVKAVASSSVPVTSDELTRKDYVDGKKHSVSIGGFFPGGASTSLPRPSFIVPPSANGLKVTKFSAVYQAGQATGETRLQWVHNGTPKQTLSITSQTPGQVVTVDIPTGGTLSSNDVVYFKVNLAGDHSDITVQLHGEIKENV